MNNFSKGSSRRPARSVAAAFEELSEKQNAWLRGLACLKCLTESTTQTCVNDLVSAIFLQHPGAAAGPDRKPCDVAEVLQRALQIAGQGDEEDKSFYPK